MSIDSALILPRAAIPTKAKVESRISEFGYDVVFPNEFEFASPGEYSWRETVLDGERTGFDYALGEWMGEAGGGQQLPIDIGDNLLEFGRRGLVSSKLVTLVEWAICDLTGARGLVDGEIIASDDMIRQCSELIEDWDAFAAQVEDSRATIESFVQPVEAKPALSEWLRNGGYYSLLGTAIALVILAGLIFW